jgi:hypothetical protein
VTVLPLVQALTTMTGQTLDTILNGNIGKLILVPTAESSVAGSLILAQALTRHVGLLATAQVGNTRKTKSPFDPGTGMAVDTTTSELQVVGALALTIDGSPAGFPLAIMGEYKVQHANEKSPSSTEPGAEVSESQVSHFAGGGLYYSGRRDLQLGVGMVLQAAMKQLEGVDAAGQPALSGSPSLFMGQFILRYVW